MGKMSPEYVKKKKSENPFIELKAILRELNGDPV